MSIKPVKPKQKTVVKILFSAGLLVLLASLAILLDSFDFESKQIEPKIFRQYSAGNNGLWLRYWWYRGKHSENDWVAMLKRLNDHKIRYAYFHVLGIKPDGHLEYHQPEEAKKITARVHASCPQTLCLAWVYIPSDFARKGVDLSKAEVRRNLHAEADWLINECGFDGVQWDYEFAPNDDRRLITFLKESRERIARPKHLSIATPMSYPGTLWGWNDAYFKETATLVDQIAVMSYDSFLWAPRWYGNLVARQVTNVSSAAREANKNCTVIIGVPTYEDRTLAHQSFCESLGNSLRGVQQGLKKSAAGRDSTAGQRVIEGVALFADYTTDGDEWKTFDETMMVTTKPRKAN